MFKNFILTTFRNSFKDKGYFIINILGLGIGLTSFIFISMYVLHEFSYDRWHKKHKNIYRVTVTSKSNDHDMAMARTGAPMASALLNDIPEVELVTRLRKSGERLISYKDKKFVESNLIFADSSFFEIFDFKLITGNLDDVLIEPRSIILSESSVKKYFGSEYPIGKNLSIGSDTVFYVVKGVVEDAPINSHFHYDMIASMSSLRASRSEQWTNHNLYTYLLAHEGTTKEIIETKMEPFIEKYIGPDLARFAGISMADFKERGESYTFNLQAIKDIHFKSNLHGEIEANGNITYINIFSIIALFILIIAIINFINLSTAKSTSRAKEVGVKKTIGATKLGLIIQFIGESILLTLVAAFLACLLVQILGYNFNQLLGFKLPNFFFTNIKGNFLISGLVILVGILAGIYPAFVLSAFRPVTVLKGSISVGNKSKWLRQGLVIFQFTISITIIIGAIVINNQLSYLQKKNLGFDKGQLLVVKNPYTLGGQIEAFKQELRQNPNILNIANSLSIPGKDYSIHSMLNADESDKNRYQIMHNQVSIEYPKALGLELIEGRFFSKEFGTDSSAVLINETAAKLLGFDDPIGKTILRILNHDNFTRMRVIGVVKDYHTESLHSTISPLCLSIIPFNGSPYLIIRLNTSNTNETIDLIDKTWTSYNNRQPLQYYFFDQEYASLYTTESKTSHLFNIFAFLAIFIACLGLLGLITYSSVVRKKEIGIRKVHGASVFSIIKLLSTEVLTLILISTLIAWIISYFGVKSWLQGFANHISIQPLIFIIAALIALLIGCLAISIQTSRAASKNPIDALKYE